MKCDELQRYSLDVDYEEQALAVPDDNGAYMDAYEVDEAIEELKEFAEDACLERDDNQTAIDELQAENAELKAEIESLKASHYAEMVDANMENRKLKRALWLARAERAKEFRYKIGFAISSMNTKFDYSDADKWQKVERKCLKKAEEYK